MNKFLMVVPGLVDEECRTLILHHDMDISRIMVYSQQIEKTKLKKISKEVKRLRPINNINQGSKRVPLYNIPRWSTSIGFLTLLKEKMEVLFF